MKVLVFTPLHPKYGAKPQTWKSVQDAVMAYGGPVEWHITHNDNTFDAHHYQAITAHHNRARQRVLEGDYDALLSIEADMVVPPDVIDRLLEVDAGIVYGLYVWRHFPDRWNATVDHGLFGTMSINARKDQARAAWGKVVDVMGLGMGCTLIRRPVLEQIEFRLYDGRHDWITEEYGGQFNTLGVDPYKPRYGMLCDDWMLAMDAQHYGISQKAHLGVVCGHVDETHVLWPSPAAPDMFYGEVVNG